ncbi:MAG: sugar phosphate isomerase/epimerase [Planctomycetes bacterium]|nr:sugar phosphate isomerase/epimerase [Planctomycetota bacterium]
MKIGITQLVMRKDGERMNIKDSLEFCKDAGYEAIELVIADDCELNTDTPESQLKEWKAMGDEMGVEIASLCAGGRAGTLINPDPEENKKARDNTLRVLETAGKMGVSDVLIVLGAVSEALPYDVAYDTALKTLQEMKPDVEKIGVNFDVEYVWGKFLVSPLEMRDFLDKIDSKNIGFYFDNGNMMIIGFGEQWAKICGKHINRVHVKDFVRKDYKFVPLTEGDTNWPLLMATLRDIGYDGPIIQECSGDLDAHRKTAETMRKIVEM